MENVVLAIDMWPMDHRCFQVRPFAACRDFLNLESPTRDFALEETAHRVLFAAAPVD